VNLFALLNTQPLLIYPLIILGLGFSRLSFQRWRLLLRRLLIAANCSLLFFSLSGLIINLNRLSSGYYQSPAEVLSFLGKALPISRIIITSLLFLLPQLFWFKRLKRDFRPGLFIASLMIFHYYALSSFLYRNDFLPSSWELDIEAVVARSVVFVILMLAVYLIRERFFNKA
jgi:hypothetical protein